MSEHMAQWSVEPQVPQEVQFLVSPGQEQARELQTVGLVSAHVPTRSPAAQPPLETRAERDRRMRSRVLCISIVIAIYVIINGLVQYTFDMAAMRDAFEKIREVTHQGGPNLATFLLHTAPSLGMSIATGLLIPLCGYLGVKQNQTGLVGAFCACSALNCCCALLSTICLFVLATSLQVMAPSVELFLEGCDPMQCIGPDSDLGVSNHTDFSLSNLTDKAHATDCLAASMWREYTPRFSGFRLPPKCPVVFLSCASFPEEPESFKGHTAGTFSDASAPARVAGLGDYGAALASEVPRTDRFGSSPRFRAFHQGLRRLTFSLSQVPQENHRHRVYLFGGKRRRRPPMPVDPIAECKPTKAAERFHQIRLLVPTLLPKLRFFIFVRSLLLCPFVVFGCLGFCWGKDLFARLNYGYNPVGATNANLRQQVLHHPAVVAAAPGVIADSTQTQIDEPLMLHVPPAPPPLDQSLSRSESQPEA